jgi:5-methylthioadenosine/S-adenosylhomocysteine deaminase
MWSDWQRTGAPLRLKPRRLVELATIEGAKLLGLGDKTGSLTPGKRADLIMIRTTNLNMVGPLCVAMRPKCSPSPAIAA